MIYIHVDPKRYENQNAFAKVYGHREQYSDKSNYWKNRRFACNLTHFAA